MCVRSEVVRVCVCVCVWISSSTVCLIYEILQLEATSLQYFKDKITSKFVDHQSNGDLQGQFQNDLLWQMAFALLHEKYCQVAAVTVLHGEGEYVSLDEALFVPDDVWVIEFREKSDFLHRAFSEVGVRHFAGF